MPYFNAEYLFELPLVSDIFEGHKKLVHSGTGTGTSIVIVVASYRKFF
jgi:hypothetical protein